MMMDRIKKAVTPNVFSVVLRIGIGYVAYYGTVRGVGNTTNEAIEDFYKELAERYYSVR